MELKEEITKVAYELYEKKGRHEGGELENWCEAERIVMARRTEKKSPGKVAAKAKTVKKSEKG